MSGKARSDDEAAKFTESINFANRPLAHLFYPLRLPPSLIRVFCTLVTAETTQKEANHDGRHSATSPPNSRSRLVVAVANLFGTNLRPPANLASEIRPLPGVGIVDLPTVTIQANKEIYP